MRLNIIKTYKISHEQIFYIYTALAKLMILDKTGVQASRPRTNSSPHKTFYSFSVTPGKTNYIFKKIKPAEEIEVNCLPNFKSARDSELSPAYPRHKNTRNYPELKIQTSTQISCTSFMKSYVEKLKKQRKRQNKKMRQSRNQKQLSEKHSFGSKAETTKNDIYLAKQMNHIFILERVSKKGGSGINTISLVEQDTNDILQQKFSKEKTAKWEQPAWANKERIDKLIRQIRNSRSKIGGSDEMAAISEEHVREHKMQGPNLPSIASRQRDEVKTRGKSKQTKRVELNFKTLEPWKQEQNMQDFSIQEYNVKCTSQ